VHATHIVNRCCMLVHSEVDRAIGANDSLSSIKNRTFVSGHQNWDSRWE
jgi:hypothetical protein